jgi:hypothetical protein
MDDRHEIDASTHATPLSGQAARRRFLRASGQVAIATPAAVLLLSAGKASAIDDVYTLDAGPDFGPDNT